MKEFIHKQLVNLKRAPHRIPLLILIICCMIYTFSLTEHSNASMYVNSDIVALYVFIITLASMLAVISYIYAYSGGREHIRMLIVAIALILVQVLFGALYLRIMFFETMERANPVPITKDIAASMNMTMVHIGSLAAALAAVLLKPVYHRALLKIKTLVPDAEESNISDTTSIDEEFPDVDELEQEA